MASKYLDKIIARWEWRTFSASLAVHERAIGPLADVVPRCSSEIYILSLHGPQNANDGLIDIKRLQQVDDDWAGTMGPMFKAKFPLSRKKIEVHSVHFSKGSETKEEPEDNHVVNLVLQR